MQHARFLENSDTSCFQIDELDFTRLIYYEQCRMVQNSLSLHSTYPDPYRTHSSRARTPEYRHGATNRTQNVRVWAPRSRRPPCELEQAPAAALEKALSRHSFAPMRYCRGPEKRRRTICRDRDEPVLPRVGAVRLAPTPQQRRRGACRTTYCRSSSTPTAPAAPRARRSGPAARGAAAAPPGRCGRRGFGFCACQGSRQPPRAALPIGFSIGELRSMVA